MNETPLVRLSGLAKDYGGVRAVHPLDLSFEDGDFLAILGPSGCGKTTLLRMLGGFVVPSAGRIEIAGQDVTGLPPEKRATNMVFQGYGLFPHMSVRQNIGYGLRLRGVPKAEVDAQVEEMIALVRKTGGTFVFVTHDQTEAMALSNRIVVMEKGRVVQVGSAEDIYLRPASHFVSTFVGEVNFLPATRSSNTVTIKGAFSFHAPGAPHDVEVGIRPERVRLGAAAETADHRFRGRVAERQFLGAQVQYRVTLVGGAMLSAMSIDPAIAVGQDIAVGWNDADQWVVAR